MVYRVNSKEIINPDEIRVLMPSSKPILTLVTCYPFYYQEVHPTFYSPCSLAGDKAC